MYPTLKKQQKKTFYTYSQLKTVLLVLFCFQHFINQNMSYISQSSKSGQGQQPTVRVQECSKDTCLEHSTGNQVH